MELKRAVYEHGGSRIWLEDEKGNRQLIADTYGQPYTDIVWNGIVAAGGKDEGKDGGK